MIPLAASGFDLWACVSLAIVIIATAHLLTLLHPIIRPGRRRLTKAQFLIRVEIVLVSVTAAIVLHSMIGGHLSGKGSVSTDLATAGVWIVAGAVSIILIKFA